MKISVTGQEARLTESDVLISGSQKVYTAVFTFDSSWDGLTKMSVFKPGDANRIYGSPTIEMLVTDGKAVVPWEVLKNYNKELYIGVYGTDSNSVIMPTLWCDAGKILQGTETDADNGQAPTESVYQQWVNDVSGYATTASTAAASAKASADSAAASVTQIGTSVTDAAASATAAKASETAASTSESNASASATAAKTSETNASSRETAAKTSETNAASSASAASTSANSAATSATSASGSETNAKASETAAASSASSASTSATASSTSASAAKTSETNAASSATSAAGSASAAATSETNAASSATSAAASAAQAETAAGGGLTVLVVTSLPTTGIKTSAIYLVPKTTTGTNNLYDEYMYINSKWELIGDTTVDLSGYYTKTQTDSLLSAKADETEVSTVKQDLSTKEPKHSQTAITLSYASWTGTADPYIYTISTVTCTATQNIEIALANNLTNTQIMNIAKYGITPYSQDVNSIVLQAKKKPTEDVSIIVSIGGEPI